ncbi:PREDICTED: uncharacterized protein LOC102022409 isoform X1 [Chinchilla lanigera]|uniref:uncharacterized protein LOC102022409 isoform X1 n=1 Tax=Chinchilla lanigera TaxID=34839 RepID=UPI000695F0B7|nr:PREDICTED: uncharacterized protein LOC102022409 isoform X1 [Chinchilla lanigera]
MGLNFPHSPPSQPPLFPLQPSVCFPNALVTVIIPLPVCLLLLRHSPRNVSSMRQGQRVTSALLRKRRCCRRAEHLADGEGKSCRASGDTGSRAAQASLRPGTSGMSLARECSIPKKRTPVQRCPSSGTCGKLLRTQAQLVGCAEA